jgi:hypothetical protein
MDKAEMKRLLQQYLKGMRLMNERVIQERRDSTFEERLKQASIWFGIMGNAGGKRDGKREEEVRQTWARFRKAWLARQRA